MIRVLDLPGVRAIEARARLNALTATRVDHDLGHMVDHLLTEVLGLRGSPSSLLQAWDDYLWDNGLQDTGEDDEDDGLSDIEIWRKDGWDITGEDGKELVCFNLLAEALECIDLNLGGFPKIEIEATMWKERKANDAAPDPRAAKHNQAFLQLGGRRRRGA